MIISVLFVGVVIGSVFLEKSLLKRKGKWDGLLFPVTWLIISIVCIAILLLNISSDVLEIYKDGLLIESFTISENLLSGSEKMESILKMFLLLNIPSFITVVMFIRRKIHRIRNNDYERMILNDL